MVMGPQREVAFSKAVKSLGCFVSVDICVFSFPGMRNTKSSNCVCKVSDNETNENCNPECPFFKPSSIEHLGEPRCSMLRSEEHTSELQSRFDLVFRLLLAKQKT